MFEVRLATDVWLVHKRLCCTKYLTGTDTQKPASLNEEYCVNICILPPETFMFEATVAVEGLVG